MGGGGAKCLQVIIQSNSVLAKLAELANKSGKMSVGLDIFPLKRKKLGVKMSLSADILALFVKKKIIKVIKCQ